MVYESREEQNKIANLIPQLPISWYVTKGHIATHIYYLSLNGFILW